jgi:hypothetical protein
LCDELIVIAVLVALSSIPVDAKEVKVPTDVILGCDATCC